MWLALSRHHGRNHNPRQDQNQKQWPCESKRPRYSTKHPSLSVGHRLCQWRRTSQNDRRLHHYSIHTERSYLDWIKRFVHFHGMRSREDLAGGASGRLRHFYGPGRAWESAGTRVTGGNGVNGGMERRTVDSGGGEIAGGCWRMVGEVSINIAPLRGSGSRRWRERSGLSALCAGAQVPAKAAKEFGWQYLFASQEVSTDPLSGMVQRHHVDPAV
jgi:hypothetical protein